MSAYAMSHSPTPVATPISTHGASPQISIVNMAARQRMLSQRMILQTVLAAAGDNAQWAAAHKSLALFSDSQTRLRATVNDFDEVSARHLKETYGGVKGVGAIVDEFMQNMRMTLDCIESGRPHTLALARLVACTDNVLEALDTVTTVFDDINKGKTSLLMKDLTGIVSDIQTVAREAKIVSFNAQVIAARAGHHGREFTVVAQVLSGITTEIDSLSRKAIDLAARNKQAIHA
jgi:methyl-accepting chemotaxis protein